MVVDTDVIAAALLGEAIRGDEACAIIAKASALTAPSHWKAELASVVWKAVVLGALDPEQASEVLRKADLAPITSVDVSELWHGAMARGIAARHSTYDTLFVELAVREGVRMASYDETLQRKFRDVVLKPAVLLKRMG